MKKILIFGGSGYIGSILIDHFLSKNYEIYNIDNSLYGHDTNLNKKHNNTLYNYFDIDFRKFNFQHLKKNEFDLVVILGGLVGDPITKKYPDLSVDINHKGIENIINQLSSINFKKLMFTSTCSNYGKINESIIADENTPLKPLSLYAKQKVIIEEFLIENALKKKNNYKTIIFRFATAFGLSRRMRFDLTINEFTRDLFNNKKLEIFDEHTWRPYCHVKDFANIIDLLGIDYNKIIDDISIFNVGCDKNNYRKIDIFNHIKKILPGSNASFTGSGPDPRNYKVNFAKLSSIHQFEFKNIDYGIKEIINELKENQSLRTDLNLGNYKINDKFFLN